MKYFLIGFALWFAIGWLPQLVRAWIIEAHLAYQRKHYKGDDAWTYHM